MRIIDDVYKYCQSCSMPLKKDPKGDSTNANGSLNSMYCGYCYKNGMFLQPDITANQMKAFVNGKLKEIRFPGFLAGLFTN